MLYSISNEDAMRRKSAPLRLFARMSRVRSDTGLMNEQREVGKRSFTSLLMEWEESDNRKE